MKYFDFVKGVEEGLYICGIGGLLVSLLALIFLPVGTPEALTNSVMDDSIALLIMAFISVVFIICALLFTRRYIWVWWSVYLSNIVGGIVVVGYTILCLFGETMAHDSTVYAFICYWIISIFYLRQHLDMRNPKVKALFRKWKG